MTCSYNRGHTCHICGRHLDSYDAYTIKFMKNKDIVTCDDCSRDEHAEQQMEACKDNREKIFLNGDHENGDE